MDIWKYRLDLGIMTVKDLVLSPQPNGFFAIVIHVKIYDVFDILLML